MLTLSAPDGTAPAPAPPGLRARLAASPTAAAAGLAAATMAANLVAVVFTVDVHAAARRVRLRLARRAPEPQRDPLRARLRAAGGRRARGHARASSARPASWRPRSRRWTLRAAGRAGAAVALVSALARAPLAVALDVEQEWAAAAVPVTAVLWLLLSLQRGLLQAAREYRTVGLSIVLEALGRLAVGAALVGAGSGWPAPTLGTLASFVVVAVALGALLRRRLGPPGRERPHAPAALARPRRGAPDRRARGRRRAPERRRHPRSARARRTIRPASTRRPPWRPRRSCGSPSGSGCGCCRRRSAAPPRAATRGRCSPARSR